MFGFFVFLLVWFLPGAYDLRRGISSINLFLAISRVYFVSFLALSPCLVWGFNPLLTLAAYVCAFVFSIKTLPEKKDFGFFKNDIEAPFTRKQQVLLALPVLFTILFVFIQLYSSLIAFDDVVHYRVMWPRLFFETRSLPAVDDYNLVPIFQHLLTKIFWAWTYIFSGFNDLYLRLTVFIFYLSLLVITYLFVDLSYGKRSAHLSLLILSCIPFFTNSFTLGKSDNLAFVFSSLAFIYLSLYLRSNEYRFALSSAFFIGLGFLVKSTLGLLVPTVLTVLFFSRKLAFRDIIYIIVPSILYLPQVYRNLTLFNHPFVVFLPSIADRAYFNPEFGAFIVSIFGAGYTSFSAVLWDGIFSTGMGALFFILLLPSLWLTAKKGDSALYWIVSAFVFTHGLYFIGGIRSFSFFRFAMFLIPVPLVLVLSLGLKKGLSLPSKTGTFWRMLLVLCILISVSWIPAVRAYSPVIQLLGFNPLGERIGSLREVDEVFQKDELTEEMFFWVSENIAEDKRVLSFPEVGISYYTRKKELALVNTWLGGVFDGYWNGSLEDVHRGLIESNISHVVVSSYRPAHNPKDQAYALTLPGGPLFNKLHTQEIIENNSISLKVFENDKWGVYEIR
ncbi:MAG: glycosyltransferase family 39 protein [Candidatus Altiarchaeota archaeon]